MAYYAQINDDYTEAVIKAGGLDPGTIYYSSDTNKFFFAQPDGAPVESPTKDGDGATVQDSPQVISDSSISRVTLTSGANLDNYDPPGLDNAVAIFIKNTSGGPIDLRGLKAQPGIRRILLHNHMDSTGDLKVKKEKTTSLAPNRFSNDRNLKPGESCELIYDTAVSRWLIF